MPASALTYMKMSPAWVRERNFEAATDALKKSIALRTTTPTQLWMPTTLILLARVQILEDHLREAGESLRLAKLRLTTPQASMLDRIVAAQTSGMLLTASRTGKLHGRLCSRRLNLPSAVPASRRYAWQFCRSLSAPMITFTSSKNARLQRNSCRRLKWRSVLKCDRLDCGPGGLESHLRKMSTSGSLSIDVTLAGTLAVDGIQKLSAASEIDSRLAAGAGDSVIPDE